MQQPVLIRGELKLRNGKNVKSTEKDPNSDSDRPPEKDREAVHRCLINVEGRSGLRLPPRKVQTGGTTFRGFSHGTVLKGRH